MWVKNAEFRPSKISLYKFTKENYKRKKCGPKILILTSKIFFYKFTKEISRVTFNLEPSPYFNKGNLRFSFIVKHIT